MSAWLTIVGIGESGLGGLGDEAQRAIGAAAVLIAGRRHLDMVPEQAGQERLPWPHPFAGAYDMVLARRGTPVCILASGDPMLYGMGASLSRLVPPDEMRVLPSPSSLSLAAARLGWPLHEVTVVSVHGRPLELVHPHVHPQARLLVLSDSGNTPTALAALLCRRGFGASTLTVFEHLGSDAERRVAGRADAWSEGACAPLNVVAMECRAEVQAQVWSCLAGLPDEAFQHDGQLTKRDVRAMTLARLAPIPGQLLWDVGAGCGSIGIEWMRAHPSCRAIAIEGNASRQALIAHNRAALGVPGLHLVAGTAPAALNGLESPDVVFIGGGLTAEGVVDACWAALKPGGRFVANAVTVQSEALLVTLRERLGGELSRASVAHATPLGGFDGWRTAMPVTTLSTVKPV